MTKKRKKITKKRMAKKTAKKATKKTAKKATKKTAKKATKKTVKKATKKTAKKATKKTANKVAKETTEKAAKETAKKVTKSAAPRRTVTKDDLTAALKKIGVDEAKKVLSRYGVKKVSDLSPKEYESVLIYIEQGTAFDDRKYTVDDVRSALVAYSKRVGIEETRKLMVEISGTDSVLEMDKKFYAKIIYSVSGAGSVNGAG